MQAHIPTHVLMQTHTRNATTIKNQKTFFNTMALTVLSLSELNPFFGGNSLGKHSFKPVF